MGKLTVKEFFAALHAGVISIPPDGVLLKDRHYVDGTGQLLQNIHRRRECKGRHCVIHNPSAHGMRE